jgi:AcrR family transcriptional regulator
VARDAGVDPALVLHYYGNKADLFAAAVAMPVAPSEALAALASVERDRLGETILRLIVGIWDDPDALAVWLGLIRSATSDPDAARMLQEFLANVILDHIGHLLDEPDAALRVSLVASQVVGLGVARHVVRLEPLASASSDELVAAVGPTLQRYLTGDLG